MTSTKSLLLAGTAFLLLASAPAVRAAVTDGRTMVAQAAPQHEGDKDKKAPEKPAEKGVAKPAHEAQPQHPPAKGAEKTAPPQHQAQPKPAEAKAPEHKAPEKPAAQAQPQHEAPKAAPPQQQKAEPKREERRERRQESQKPEAKPDSKPDTAAKPATPETKPAAAEKKPEQKPSAAERKAEPKPEEKARQPVDTKPAAAPAPQKPAAQSAPTAQPPAGNAQTVAPAAAAPPTKPQSAQQFILPKNGKPTATIQDLRKERHETREGNRTVITEGDRTIIKQDNRVIIQHNETQRFAVGARDVNVERHGNETTTVIVRPDGDRIINVTDERGNLIRRVRRERSGKEVVIIDERSRPRRADVFIDLPPPVIRIPRDRYIVELDRARPQAVYEVLDAPPVEAVTETYTVDQVRYSAPLRDRMPRVDLEIGRASCRERV